MALEYIKKKCYYHFNNNIKKEVLYVNVYKRKFNKADKT